ncbi:MULTISPECIES: hypothetical protein [unclassified Streptomyces]|uniref:hypothetical protein n=1 Tax=unclassified Streptomyces TaxID=2593676 RepID=UPI0038012E54
MDAYQASRYGFATRRLPLVLADALIAAQSYDGREREQANELLALTYQSAAMVLGKVGEVDLAGIAAIADWPRHSSPATPPSLAHSSGPWGTAFCRLVVSTPPYSCARVPC